MNVKREYAIDQMIERLGGQDVTIIRDRDNEERAVLITETHLHIIQAGERYNIANVTTTTFLSGAYSHGTVYTGADVTVKAAKAAAKTPCYCDSAYHPQGH
jgi:hypothetical protein